MLISDFIECNPNIPAKDVNLEVVELSANLTAKVRIIFQQKRLFAVHQFRRQFTVESAHINFPTGRVCTVPENNAAKFNHLVIVKFEYHLDSFAVFESAVGKLAAGRKSDGFYRYVNHPKRKVGYLRSGISRIDHPETRPPLNLPSILFPAFLFDRRSVIDPLLPSVFLSSVLTKPHNSARF
jgi:hypothetical protein